MLIEPLAGGIHAALLAGRLARRRERRRPVVAVLGAGTMGLAAVAGLVRYVPARPRRRRRPLPAPAAPRPPARRPRRRAGRRARPRRAPHRRLPRRRRPPRPAAPTPRSTPSARRPRSPTCLRITRPRGRVVLMGMPAEVTLDLTGLWHRETELVGAYTYGTETLADGRRVPHVRPRHRDRRRHRGRALAHRPPTASPTTSTPSPTPPPPAAAARQDRLRPPSRRSIGTRGALMPRPGFVLDVDRSTPPTLFWRGEGFSLEKLPADRSRVIYAPEPLPAHRRHRRRDPPRPAQPDRPGPAADAAVPGHEADDRLRRHQPAAAEDAPARRPPAGDRGRARPRRRGRRRRRPPDRRPRPAPADDRGRAAPRRRRPRLRRLRAARPALPARRRGSRQPRRSSAPRRRARRSRSTSGRPSRDLLVYVNINLVAMDGGWKSTATGLASYRSLRHHHNPTTMEASHSFMDQHRSELHKSNWRMGKVLRRLRRQGVPDRDDAEHRHVPEAVRLPRPSGSGSGRAKDRATYLGTAKSLSLRADPAGPQDLPLDRGAAPDDERAGRRGRGRAQGHDRERLPPAARRGAGPDRHPDDGHPVHLPVQRATRS